MVKAKKKKDIVQPIWYIKYLSDVDKHNTRFLGEIFFSLIISFIIIISAPALIYQTYDYQITPYMILFWVILWLIIHYTSVKLVFERDLDLDKYSWVAYYCGRLGIELYRLGNFSKFSHYIEANNYSLRNRLLLISRDYRGDKSGKRKAIIQLRKKLKYVPKHVKNNINNPDILFELGNKFQNFGEYISKDKLEDRISNKCLIDLISSVPEPKKRFVFTPYNIMTHKLTIFLFCLGIGTTWSEPLF